MSESWGPPFEGKVGRFVELEWVREMARCRAQVCFSDGANQGAAQSFAKALAGNGVSQHRDVSNALSAGLAGVGRIKEQLMWELGPEEVALALDMGSGKALGLCWFVFPMSRGDVVDRPEWVEQMRSGGAHG